MNTLLARILFFLILVFWGVNGNGQNLVLNPSFEDHDSCPLSNNNLTNCDNWFFPASTAGFGLPPVVPAYFNDCTPTNNLRVPNIWYGYQYPRTGKAMIGIQNNYFDNNGASIENDYKTFPEDSFNSTLAKGIRYHVGCYINIGNYSRSFTNDFGIYISDSFVPTSKLYYLGKNNLQLALDKITPQICNPKNRMLSDTFGWTLVDGIYTAHGGERFITLGTFSNPGNTKFSENISPGVYSNFIYIDDVFVTPLPDSLVHIMEHDTTLCKNQNIVLHTNMQNSSNLQWQDGSTGDSFLVTKAGTYWVRFDSLLFSNTDSIRVYYDSVSGIIPKILNACHFPDTLQVPPSSISYIWPDGTNGNDYVIKSPGTYYYTVQNTQCKENDSIMVKNANNIKISLPQDTIVCNLPVSINLNDNNSTYHWPDGSSGNHFSIGTSGIYLYSITSGPCKVDASLNVRSGQLPEKIVPIDTVLCSNHPILFSIKDFNGSILWQDGKTDSNYIIHSSGNYSVTLKNQCGTKTYTSNIADSNCDCYLFAPNIFTPNNDHINDLFYAQSSCVPINYSLQIYNRWGERLFQSIDISNGWDGKFKNVPCASGVYIYKIIYKFPNSTDQIKSGTVVVE